MELTTFGAILRFAINLEAEAEQRYHRAAEAAGPSPAGESLRALARAKRKRRQTLERARQENVAEMILETIRGLDGADFAAPALSVGGSLTATLASLATFEERCAAFYSAAGQKIGLAEVARIFDRLAREDEEHRQKALALG